MIVELAAAIGFTLVGTVWGAARIVWLQNQLDAPKLTREAVLEKRRVLERDRSEWAGVLADKTRNVANQSHASRQMTRIDRELFALADEDRE